MSVKTTSSEVLAREQETGFTDVTGAEVKLEGIYALGYGSISRYVMCRRDIPISAKAVYSYLVSFTGGGRTCFPAVATMAADLACSENTIRKGMKMLEAKGLITIEKRVGDAGEAITNLYRLTIQMPEENREKTKAIVEKMNEASARTEKWREKAVANQQTNSELNNTMNNPEETLETENGGTPLHTMNPPHTLRGPAKTPPSYYEPPSYIEGPRKTPPSYYEAPSYYEPNNIYIYSSSSFSKGDAKNEHSFAYGCFRILNEKLAVTYTPSVEQLHFLDRYADRYSLDDVAKMLDAKIVAWGDDESMRSHLAPRTLFSPKHFAEYMENSRIRIDSSLIAENRGDKDVSGKGASAKAAGKKTTAKKPKKSPEAQAREDYYRHVLEA